MRSIKTRCIFIAVLYFLTCSFTFAADQNISTSEPQRSGIGFKAIGKDSGGTPGWIDATLLGQNTVYTCTGTNDHTALNILLAASANKKVTIRGACSISTTLTLPQGGNIWVDLAEGSSISNAADSTNGIIFQNWASRNPNRTVADGAITSGTTTLTSVNADFTSADVGRTVKIAGAGAGKYTTKGPMTADIVTVDSESQVTLSVPVINTVSGASVSIYQRDTNIKITGGSLNRGDYAGIQETQHSMYFRYIDNLELARSKYTGEDGKYFVNPAAVNRLYVHDIDCQLQSPIGSACVQGTGPLKDVFIQNMTGYSSDDYVTFIAAVNPMFMTGPTTEAYEQSTGDWDTQGAISGVVIDNLNIASDKRLVKLMGAAGHAYYNNTISNISGSGLTSVALFDDTGFGVGMGKISDTTIRGININHKTTRPLIINTDTENTTISDINLSRPLAHGTAGSNIYFGTTGVLSTHNNIIIKDVNIYGPHTNNEFFIGQSSGCVINGLNLSNINHYSTNQYGGFANLYNVVGANLSNVNFTGGGALLTVPTGAASQSIGLDNVQIKGSATLASVSASTELMFNNVKLDSLTAAYLVGSGSSTVVTTRGDLSASAWQYWRNSGFASANATAANGACTAASTPFACCTGSGAGTCGTGPKLSNHINKWPAIYNPTADAAFVTSCGTSPAYDDNSNDLRGKVTLGSGSPTSCTVNFHTVFGSAPICTVTGSGGIPVWISSLNTTSMTVTGGATFGSFAYQCQHIAE